jgi:hypothetical protein
VSKIRMCRPAHGLLRETGCSVIEGRITSNLTDANNSLSDKSPPILTSSTDDAIQRQLSIITNKPSFPGNELQPVDIDSRAASPVDVSTVPARPSINAARGLVRRMLTLVSRVYVARLPAANAWLADGKRRIHQDVDDS